MFESERQYAAESELRPRLSDDEFLERYYPHSEVRRDIPLRIRRLLHRQLGFEKVIPSDCPAQIIQDIDLQVILDEVGEEFNVRLEVKELIDRRGSFDSIAQLVNSKLEDY